MVSAVYISGWDRSESQGKLLAHTQKELKMTDIINPKAHPELAAQQLVIELIRAGKIDAGYEMNAEELLRIYDIIEKHLTEKYPQTQGGIY